jgi:CDP-6-deoxy-D-xylo-4-hexulose-3-dehydrase
MTPELEKIITEYLNENKPKYLYNKNFIKGKSQVLYSGPYWDNNEILSGVSSLLDSKWLVSGENVQKFERLFCKKFNVKFAQMVNSGSSANLILITALKKYLNWQDNDEIIVSPVGFPTTIAPIIQNNLKPIFIDIEFDTLNFDVNLIENKITKNTKAIFVSPVLGNPPDIDKLLLLCDKYDIKLLGDNCDTLGTKWDDKDITDNYFAWTTSFYPAHHISTGEGGMVCCNELELKNLFMSYSYWGRDCYCVGSANLLPCGTCKKRFDNWLDLYDGVIDHKYVFNNVGYNLKPLDLQGAIGIEQLNKFDEIDTNRKNSKKNIESIILKYVSNIRSVSTLDKSDVCWFGTPFICETKELKEKLVYFLEENKIQTRNYFAGNILIHPGFKSLDSYLDYPNANMVLDKVFFVGASPHYNEEIFEYIDEVFKTKWVN